jgi:dGTPase
MSFAITSAKEREDLILAPYAMHSAHTKGRRHSEPDHPYRSPYQRDRDRIVHSAAFRRLSQKTQVFTGDMGDYHRTRLTHTLEVASIARTIARVLRLNEDLVEALALAHDLGHPPFGHSGEDVLNECLACAGGFNHNAQALRICELLETSYRGFPGLNLSLEVLEGQQRRSQKAVANASKPNADSRPNPLLEVQVVDLADSIAYDAHDADDSLELGLLKVDQLLEVPLWRESRERVLKRAKFASDRQLLRAVVHEMIDWQVSDVIENSQSRLVELQIASTEDVLQAPTVLSPSPALSEKKTDLERFLFTNVYRHPALLKQRGAAQNVLREMFDFLVLNLAELPPKFRELSTNEGAPRAVADYLAGMTDRFAYEEHARLVG